MLIAFFQTVRAAGVPASVRELLDLLAALRAGVAGPLAPAPSSGDAGAHPWSIDAFYALSRAIMVKDEKHYDRFDRAFGLFFQGLSRLPDAFAQVPDDWLRDSLARNLSPAEREALQAMDWDTLMQTLRERLAEQHERHAGGSKWIGTGGTSPFGHGGYNPAGVRIGGVSGHRRAVKVWEQRAYRDYDDDQVLGTRQIQVALRRLRRFARVGLAQELDLPDTIRATAANAGYLDIKMVAPRHNNVKVLLLMDVGGSMDDHVARMHELFSAARSAFKHLSFYYFHNCVYDHVWRNNQRRRTERTDTWDLIRRYPRDTQLIFVGDATMSPYEILQVGGSVEYHNPEPGAVWLQRLAQHFQHHVWLNPEPEALWDYRPSIDLVRQLLPERMFGLTLRGLDAAMQRLSK